MRSLDRPTVAGVGLGWWSIWLSTAYLSLFICSALARWVPPFLRDSVGWVSLPLRHYIAYAIAIEKYNAFCAWTLVLWITWLTLIDTQSGTSTAAVFPAEQPAGNATSIVPILQSASTLNTMTQTSFVHTASHFFFGVVICAALLLGEKLCIQVIAYNFHQVSYASRIDESNRSIAVLARLYAGSKDKLTQPDTDLAAERPLLGTFNTFAARAVNDQPAWLYAELYALNEELKPRNNAVAAAAATLGADDPLVPGSARRVVILSLGSAEQTRHLARRIFFSFAHAQDTSPEPTIGFSDFLAAVKEEALAHRTWLTFDRDGNGNIMLDEMVEACQLIRNERKGLLDSVRDIGSVVGSLDSMLMSVHWVVSLTLLAAMLSVKFSQLVLGLGSIVLGLSWLLSGNAQELLQSIVFLFLKHPYDVGDLVRIIDLQTDLVVTEMHMLSTTFRNMAGESVHMSNMHLATGSGIVNLRRSGPIEEPFSIDFAHETTYLQLESLRSKMLEWIQTQERDFLPGLDLRIASMDAASRMSITVGIRYKSNTQEYLLRQRRRNRWLCRFKEVTAELQIRGPSADPQTQWIAHKGEAARAAVRGGPEREYLLMDDRESDAVFLQQRTPWVADEGQPVEAEQQHPPPTIARSEAENFRHAVESYRQHNAS